MKLLATRRRIRRERNRRILFSSLDLFRSEHEVGSICLCLLKVCSIGRRR